MPWNTIVWRLDTPKSPEKCIFFSKGELNCKGESSGEKILNEDINHDILNEIASNNLDKNDSQGRFATFLYKLDL